MVLFRQTVLGSLIPLVSLLGACASQPAPVSQSDVSVTEATVTAVDHSQRRVTLKEKDGSESTIGVSAKPGHSALIAIPRSKSWGATERTKPTTACLVSV